MSVHLFATDGGRVFATTQDAPYVNAWGQYRVDGIMFDTDAGTVETGKVATCNLPTTTLSLVAGVFSIMGESLVDGATWVTS